MFEYVVQVTVALSLLAIAYGANWLRQWLPTRQNIKEALSRSSQMQLANNKLQHDAKSQRTTFCQAKNCGSLLQPSEPWSSTILYETTSEELGPKQDAWVSQPIDGVYRTLLHEAFEGRCRVVHADDLPRSILRSLYDRDGVKSAVMSIVSHTPGKIFYTVVEFTHRLEDEELPVVEESVRAAGIQFKRLM